MGQRLTGIAVALLLFIPPPCAFAHADLSEYVQHEVNLEAGASYIDLTLELTFFDELAEAQRVSLDGDGNGEFSPEERAAYEQAVLSKAEKGLSLQADGAALELVSRFDPEIACAVPGSGGAHLRFEIRLYFFAQRPLVSAAGVSLEVRDGLFGELPAMASLRVTGNEGFQIGAVDGDGARAAGAEAPLILKAGLKPSENAVRSHMETSGTRKQGE